MKPTLSLASGSTAVRDRELFVVATHKVRDKAAAAPNEWVPYGTEHAWRPGTRKTLCGEFMSGWTVFWDRHFSARPATACPACVEMTLPEASRRRLDRIQQSPVQPTAPSRERGELGHAVPRAS